jgi:hypothetical protein
MVIIQEQANNAGKGKIFLFILICRWHNHLDPEIKKDYWTEKEESILFIKHVEFGNKWSDIAKFLPGR